jgi:hypothetical protein
MTMRFWQSITDRIDAERPGIDWMKPATIVLVGRKTDGDLGEDWDADNAAFDEWLRAFAAAMNNE